ncbi:MAG TPA: hypothetical protein VMR86_14755 [Myxococcota bacterium]|nr:hypothetical protein [Myxococcota bacterium]
MSLFVGARLIRRGLPTRAAPELLMGIAYFAAPGVGYPMVVASNAIADRLLSTLVFALGHSLIALGVSVFFFFNARVFRAGQSAAQAFAAVCSIVFSLAALEIVRGHNAVGSDLLGLASVRSAMVILLFVLGLAYAWTAWEGFRHHRLMLRRARVGLGDAVVANRFLLWGFAGSLQVFANLVSAWALWSGDNMLTNLPSMLATAGVGVVNSVLLVLIFLPPARYVRWLQRDPRGALAAV